MMTGRTTPFLPVFLFFVNMNETKMPNKSLTQLLTQIVSPDVAGLEAALAALGSSQVVAIPTETVYGLAGNAFDPEAVAQIFAAKERPAFDPLIIHLAADVSRSLHELAAQQLIDLESISKHQQQALDRLIAHFWPGPMTLVLPRHARVPDLVTAGLETVGLRVPAHPVAQALLSTGLALAAPSANRFGRISPTSAQAVYAELAGRIPLIVDGGPCVVGLESSIVALQADALTLLRPGQISADEIAQIGGLPCLPAKVHPAEILAPGMLKSHYAPRQPLQLFTDRKQLAAMEPGKGLLLLSAPDPELIRSCQEREIQIEVLSPTGDLAEVAQHLFAALRRLDQADLAGLWAELPLAGAGLAHAIRDRLLKAAAPKN